MPTKSRRQSANKVLTWIAGSAAVWLARPSLSQPDPRAGGALSFDAARGVLVLHGGRQGQTMLGDTWEHDGREWRRVQTASPGPCFGCGSAFDPVDRAYRIYIGGVGGGTWDWDGNAWRMRSPQDLRTNWGAAMAYDERRGVMVLHGGSPTYPNPSWSETWEWRGGDWVFVSDTGPVAHYNCKMAYDSRRGVCVFFTPTGVTQEWDGTAWRIATTSGPPGRYTSGMAYDPVRGVTVLFGGGRTSPAPYQLGDTWEYDGQAWREAATVGPAPRSHHAMTFDIGRGRTVLFGGYDGQTFFNDTWQWDGRTWTLFRPCYADCDTSTGAYTLDIFDFLCFQNRYAAGTPYACDCDTSSGQGVCDIFDFLCFQNAYAAGCP